MVPHNSLAAGSSRGRHLELFRVRHGAVEHRWWLPDEGWSPWDLFGDSPTGVTALACASSADDNLAVFALGHAGEMFVKWWSLDDWWGAWQSLGGPVYTPIAAASLEFGHVEIYAYSGDSTLVSRYLRPVDGAWEWSPWQAFS